jgi:hypothetical protein
MACNNTQSKGDTRIANASVAPLTHPGTNRSRPEIRPELLDLIHTAYPEFISLSATQIRDKLLDERTSSAHKQWFQQIGETYATRGFVASQLGVGKINLPYDRQTSFQQARHGFDHVGMAKDGRLAVFETKCYTKDLSDEGLDQLSMSHVNSRLERMQREGSKQAQGSNPEIASLAAYTGVARYLVHVGYESQSVKVYEVTDDASGNPVRGAPVLEAHAKDFMGGLYSLYFVEED